MRQRGDVGRRGSGMLGGAPCSLGRFGRCRSRGCAASDGLTCRIRHCEHSDLTRRRRRHKFPGSLFAFVRVLVPRAVPPAPLRLVASRRAMLRTLP
eukprot:2713066-Pleurochrysis_carterae.AAC.1